MAVKTYMYRIEHRTDTYILYFRANDRDEADDKANSFRKDRDAIATYLSSYPASRLENLASPNSMRVH